MRNAKHYKIGLTNEKFDNKRFCLWLAMGWIQAGLIYLIVYKATQSYSWGVSSPGSSSYNLWAGGQNSYATCVIIVNLTILQMQHNWTFWNELLVFIQISCYFAMVAFMNEIPVFWQVYKFIPEYTTNVPAWLAMILLVVVSILAMKAD